MKKVNRHKLPGNLKAQGLSLDTIIIAAIVLIVLIVLWAIFTGRMGSFTKNVGDEDAKAQLNAVKIQAESAGSGTCIPNTICSTQTGTTSDCASIGCTGGGTAPNNKCTGGIPSKECSLYNDDPALCDTSPICDWIGLRP